MKHKAYAKPELRVCELSLPDILNVSGTPTSLGDGDWGVQDEL